MSDDTARKIHAALWKARSTIRAASASSPCVRFLCIVHEARNTAVRSLWYTCKNSGPRSKAMRGTRSKSASHASQCCVSLRNVSSSAAISSRWCRSSTRDWAMGITRAWNVWNGRLRFSSYHCSSAVPNAVLCMSDASATVETSAAPVASANTLAGASRPDTCRPDAAPHVVPDSRARSILICLSRSWNDT